MAGAAAEEKTPKTGGKEIDEKTLAFVAYVLMGLSGIIVFIIGKSKLSKFHGMQSFLLSVVVFVIQFVLSTIAGLFFNPYNPGSWGIATTLWNLMSLLWAVAWLYGIFIGLTKAYKGEIYKMPYIGEYADQFSR